MFVSGEKEEDVFILSEKKNIHIPFNAPDAI